MPTWSIAYELVINASLLTFYLWKFLILFLISLSFSNECKQEEKSLQWHQLLLNTDLYGPEKRNVESDCTVRTGLKARDRHSYPSYSRWENWFFLGFVSAMIQDFVCPVWYSRILAGTAFRGWSRFTGSCFLCINLFYFLCKDNFSLIKLPVFIYLFLR